MTTILAIDDRQDNLITVSALLKAFLPEADVLTAPSGPAGIEAAKTEYPDVILLDIKMPQMDGFETCRRLKSDEAVSHIPVIMLTAVNTDAKSRVKALELGADAFLSKPINEMELAAQIKVMLRIKKAEDVLRNQRNSLADRVQERTFLLRESEKRYRMLFNSVRDMVLIHPFYMKGRPKPFIEVNETACERLEYSREEMLTLTPADILTEQGVEDLKAEAVRLDARKHLLFEIILISRTGSHIPVEVNSQLFDWKGEKTAVSVVRDITERKRSEKEKRRLEEKLHQIHKMKAISTLTGGIAHKFNNLLSIIVGNAELASEDIPPHSPVQHFLKEIFKASLQGKKVVRQLMGFSRPAGHHQENVSISAVASDAVGFIRASLPSGIQLEFLNDPLCEHIAGDPTQIHQVLINLCSNAVHAMENGGTLRIVIENRFLDSPLRFLDYELDRGNYVCMQVKDTGAGIDPEHLNRVFDPFFTTKDVDKGSGMGLTVVHSIMKGHGGGVRITGKPGEGTVIECYFPSAGLSETSVKSSVTEVESALAAQKSILFLDDDAAIVQVTRLRLERLGFRVQAGTDPSDILSLFSQNPEEFDLVITDLSMPQMNGDQVIRRLHALRPGVKTILCTGYNEKIDKEKMRQIGADALLLKPHSKKELAETVQKTLGLSVR